jgi:hypothetical protein
MPDVIAIPNIEKDRIRTNAIITPAVRTERWVAFKSAPAIPAAELNATEDMLMLLQ